MPILAWIVWQLFFVKGSSIDRMVLFEQEVIFFLPRENRLHV